MRPPGRNPRRPRFGLINWRSSAVGLLLSRWPQQRVSIPRCMRRIRRSTCEWSSWRFSLSAPLFRSSWRNFPLPGGRGLLRALVCTPGQKEPWDQLSNPPSRELVPNASRRVCQCVSEVRCMTFFSQQYPEEIAALKSDEARLWHSWGNGSHTGCSFNTRKGVKTLVGKLRKGRMVFYGVFDGLYPRDTPLRLVNAALPQPNADLCSCGQCYDLRLRSTRDQKRGPMDCQFSGRTER